MGALEREPVQDEVDEHAELTPDDLRAMVMTAVIAINTVAAPLGFLVAGQVLEHWGVVPLFAGVVLGISAMAVVFAAIVLRHRDAEIAVAEPAAS